MRWKNRLTNYNFWISIVSAVLLIFQAFDFHFDVAYINEIATAVLGLLVVIGIINDPTKTTVEKVEVKTEPKEEKVETKEEIKPEEIVPIDNTNEVDNVNSKDDFETVIATISNNLEQRFMELKLKQEELLKKQEELFNKPEEGKEEKQIENPTVYNIVN